MSQLDFKNYSLEKMYIFIIYYLFDFSEKTLINNFKHVDEDDENNRKPYYPVSSPSKNLCPEEKGVKNENKKGICAKTGFFIPNNRRHQNKTKPS